MVLDQETIGVHVLLLLVFTNNLTLVQRRGRPLHLTHKETTLQKTQGSLSETLYAHRAGGGRDTQTGTQVNTEADPNWWCLTPVKSHQSSF